ncbi:MAG TPA: MFS transporter [Dehalococcoidia bacterium]|nr:MFS transporter [Dehalococcoidia bacterium]
MRRLLAYRDARLLLAGQMLSLFGDRAMFLVLGIWVKALTGSNAAAVLVFFAYTAPALGAPLAGLLVDRVRRRPLMITTDLVIGASMFLLLLVHSRDQVWLIYMVALLYGCADLAFGSAQSALLTVLLPGDLLGEANAAFQTVRQGMRLIAPLAGAALYAAFGGGTVAVIDAATFACSAFCLWRLRTPEPAPAPQRANFRREVSAGLRHIRQTLPLRQIVLAVGVALLVIGFGETLLFAVIDQGLHRPPSFFGVIGAAQGVGAVAGGLTAAALLRRLGDGRLVGAGLLLFALGDGLLVISVTSVVLGGIALAGVGLSWAVVGFGTAIQRRSPAELQGRVASAADLLAGTPQTISIAAGAALSTLLDFRLLLLLMSGVIAVCAGYLLTRRTFQPGAAAAGLPTVALAEAP